MERYEVVSIGNHYGIIDHKAGKLVEDAVGIALFLEEYGALKHIERLTA